MKIVFLYILALFLLIACEPKDDLANLNGNYVGSYTRGDSVSAISISISDYSYEGSSDVPFFPAIGEGTVGWNEYNIEFTNERDWSIYGDDLPQWLIKDNTYKLNDLYEYTYSGGKLSFWRGVGEHREIYTIEKLKD